MFNAVCSKIEYVGITQLANVLKNAVNAGSKQVEIIANILFEMIETGNQVTLQKIVSEPMIRTQHYHDDAAVTMLQHLIIHFSKELETENMITFAHLIANIMQKYEDKKTLLNTLSKEFNNKTYLSMLMEKAGTIVHQINAAEKKIATEALADAENTIIPLEQLQLEMAGILHALQKLTESASRNDSTLLDRICSKVGLKTTHQQLTLTTKQLAIAKWNILQIDKERYGAWVSLAAISLTNPTQPDIYISHMLAIRKTKEGKELCPIPYDVWIKVFSYLFSGSENKRLPELAKHHARFLREKPPEKAPTSIYVTPSNKKNC